jgi:protein TonB
MPVAPPRVVVPVDPPKPLPRPPAAVAPARTTPTPSPVVPVVVEDGVLPVTVELPAVTPVQAPADASIAPVPPGPAAMRLEYASAPPPPYPRPDLRAGHEGTVILQVVVGVDGRPLEVSVAESSGHRGLDAAARRHVLSAWLFRPAMRDGRAVEAIGLVPVSFSLR